MTFGRREVGFVQGQVRRERWAKDDQGSWVGPRRGRSGGRQISAGSCWSLVQNRANRNWRAVRWEGRTVVSTCDARLTGGAGERGP